MSQILWSGEIVTLQKLQNVSITESDENPGFLIPSQVLEHDWDE